jgi:hypothetical protein
MRVGAFVSGFKSVMIIPRWYLNEQRRQPIQRSKIDTAERFFLDRKITRRNRKVAMISESTRPSPYEQRVSLVRETLMKYSPLEDAAAGEVAVHVLHALNSIPEKIR